VTCRDQSLETGKSSQSTSGHTLVSAFAETRGF